jgi:hypothetical protein
VPFVVAGECRDLVGELAVQPLELRRSLLVSLLAFFLGGRSIRRSSS